MYNYILIVVLVFVLRYFYNKWSFKENRKIDDKILQNYFYEDVNSITMINKPNLWIYIPLEPNSRDWINFFSRMTNNLNQPYIILCLVSIIENCKDDFNIILYNDKLLETIEPKIKTQPSPVSDYYRNLANLKLLFNYGGWYLPMSTICLKNLNSCYWNNMGKGGFAVLDINHTSSSKYTDYFPSGLNFAFEKYNPTLKEIMGNYENKINLSSSQRVFNGYLQQLLYKYCKEGNIGIVSPNLFGRSDKYGNAILIDDLFSTNYIDFDYSSMVALYLPYNEILNRKHFKWFARMSENQILNSNLFIHKIFILGLGISNNH